MSDDFIRQLADFSILVQTGPKLKRKPGRMASSLKKNILKLFIRPNAEYKKFLYPYTLDKTDEEWEFLTKHTQYNNLALIASAYGSLYQAALKADFKGLHEFFEELLNRAVKEKKNDYEFAKILVIASEIIWNEGFESE